MIGAPERRAFEARRWCSRPVIGALAVALEATAAQAADPPADDQGGVAAAWQSVRRAAVTHGFDLTAVYDGEALANARGGVRTGGVYVGALRLGLTIDGSRLLGWEGMTVFASGLHSHGGAPSGFVGDAQGVSNLAAPTGAELYEAWIQQNLFDNRVSVLAGRYDLNTEFYRLQSAGLFLNSSFGAGPEFSQSGHGGPSMFPDPSVGVRLGVKPARGVVVRAAMLDGAPVYRPGVGDRVFAPGDGLLFVGESAFLSRPARASRPQGQRLRIGRNSGLPPYESKVAIGGWCYTARFDDTSERLPNRDPVSHLGSTGAYLLLDALLNGGAAQPRRPFHGFVQLGLGDFRVDRFGFYGGAGVTVSGFIPALASDELGLAVALARNGAHYLDDARRTGDPATRAEVAIEGTYLLQMGEHLALQPDLQYVVSPGTDPPLKNAIVFALRFELAT